MKITYKTATEVNGYALSEMELAASINEEVFVNGELWGWVSSPCGRASGTRGKSWIALAVDGYGWGEFSSSRLAAVVACF